MFGWCDGFPNLSSINFSGLSSLTSVGNNWMNSGVTSNSFVSMVSINVGSIPFGFGFDQTNFYRSWPTSRIIYYSDTDETTGNSWKVGGLVSWTPTKSQ